LGSSWSLTRRLDAVKKILGSGSVPVDVRLEDGNFVRNVPVDFFRP
jgi:hypothetical protein